MKKQWIILFSITAAICLLSGCGSQSANNGKGTSDKPIDIAFHSNAVGGALSVLAENAGFNKEEGLNIKLHVLNGPGSDSLSALSTGKVILTANGVGSSGPLLQIDNGADFVIIGGQMSSGADLIALPERQAEFAHLTADSVKGKKFGVTRASSGDIALRGALAKQGIDLSTIQFVEIGSAPAIIEAVKKGEVDVGNVATNMRDTAHEQGLVSAMHVDELAPNFICCRLITTRKALAERRTDFVHYLRAELKAYRLLKTDRDKTIPLVGKSVEVGDKILQSQLYDYGHFDVSPDPTKKRIEDYFESMKAIGYIEGKVDIDDHIDTSLYREALGSLLEEEPDDPIWNKLKQEYIENDGDWD